jgi:hypothetical protein
VPGSRAAGCRTAISHTPSQRLPQSAQKERSCDVRHFSSPGKAAARGRSTRSTTARPGTGCGSQQMAASTPPSAHSPPPRQARRAARGSIRRATTPSHFQLNDVPITTIVVTRRTLDLIFSDVPVRSRQWCRSAILSCIEERRTFASRHRKPRTALNRPSDTPVPMPSAGSYSRSAAWSLSC